MDSQFNSQPNNINNNNNNGIAGDSMHLLDRLIMTLTICISDFDSIHLLNPDN